MTVLIAAILIAQAPGVLQQPSQPTGSLTVRTVDRASGKPLAQIPVQVYGLTSKSGVTDASGSYTFPDLSAGSWGVINAKKDGYVNTSKQIRLSPSSHVDVVLELDRESILSGTVRDAAGLPVGGAMVSARAYIERDGRTALQSFRSGSTDKDGTYKIGGLFNNRYFILVEPRLIRMDIVHRAAGLAFEPKGPLLSASRQYFVNGPSIETAVPLEIPANTIMDRFDFKMAERDTFCVEADIKADLPIPKVQVRLTEPYPESQSFIASTEVTAGETIEICRLPPGVYRLDARGATAEKPYLGSVQFRISDRSMLLPQVIMQPAQDLAGGIHVAGDPPQPAQSGVRVRLESTARMMSAGEVWTAVVDESNRFVIPNVLPDEYWVTVSGLKEGFYVREILSNGIDLMRYPLPAAKGPIEIAVAPDGPAVVGAVVDENRAPVTNACVTLVTKDFPLINRPSDFQIARSDQNGTFQFSGFPAGQYKIVALTGLGANGCVDHASTIRFLSSAELLSLAPGERRSVRLSPVNARR